MGKLISGIVLIACIVIMTFVLFTVFKLLALALGLWLAIYICWLVIKPLFKDEEPP